MLVMLPICKHIAKAPRANAATKALSKSLQSQRIERNCFKKFADTKKNKKRWHTSRQKRKSKIKMTRKLNNDNGLQDRKTEHQAVTGGIFYCRDSAGFSVSAFNKLSCNLTGQCFEIGNKNIPSNVSVQLKAQPRSLSCLNN